MYSKEELKKLKTEFWTAFGQFSQLKRSRLGNDKKWILYKTGIKGLELKFDFYKKSIIVAIEIDLNVSKSDSYIQKIELLKEELLTEDNQLPFFELRESKQAKNSFLIFFEKENLNFKKRADWPNIFVFFFDHMMILEDFVLENREIINQ